MLPKGWIDPEAGDFGKASYVVEAFIQLLASMLFGEYFQGTKHISFPQNKAADHFSFYHNSINSIVWVIKIVGRNRQT